MPDADIFVDELMAVGIPWAPATLIADAINDVAGSNNVLEFGADPTGVADSTAAFNEAAAQVAPGTTRHKAVYFPTGTYRINGQINLTAGQEFYGDSRGSSVLLVNDQFDPTATAVIFLTASALPLGPFLHDFSITFAQPSDQGSRANFKTLAAGGTSSLGGTGVKYPWAIASGSNSMRVQIVRVQIGGAWDGITSNGHNTVFFLEDIEMGAFDCGYSLGEGAGGSGGVLDFCHITTYHFWNFGITGNLFNVFADGETIAMRMGRVDGIEIKGFTSFMGRFIITPDTAGHGSVHFDGCFMDTDQATIEINGSLLQLSITNLSGSAGTVRVRPFITVAAACNLNITNYYSHSTSAFSDFLLTDNGANVNLANFRTLFYTNDTPWVTVQRGKFRAVHGNLYLLGPRTVPAISETTGGVLFLDDIWVNSTTPSGPLISIVTNSVYTMIGRLELDAGHSWTFTLPAGLTQHFYSPITRFEDGQVFAQSFLATDLLQAGQVAGGNPGSVALFGAAGEQIGFFLKRGSLNGWTILSQTSTNDLRFGRYDDSGVFQGNLINLTRAGGIGFYGATPVVKQTGVAVTAAAIHAALTTLGLIAP